MKGLAHHGAFWNQGACSRNTPASWLTPYYLVVTGSDFILEEALVSFFFFLNN